ncbi:uncharacterized protein LOC127526146 [Erpetoichthys calabaricus]|uniref:uncharacterized protein LOC127526146 n=1 Tax=Erpetoichthys calabaricus TaxID=27687 RepID=UPI0022345503|nr:uncharacterized protein LOC127526146 [Erpetoichthys calabaricus]
MTGSLSLFRLTLRDSGQYSVSIITAGGETVSGSVTLNVLDCCAKVSLITPQYPVNATVGGEATFDMSIDPPSEQAQTGVWKFGPRIVVTWIGTNIVYVEEYNGRVELIPATGTLKFNKVLASDSGEYKVTITTEESFANLNGKVELNVYDSCSAVSLITQTPVIGKVDREVTFNVSIEPSSEQANIGMWTFGSKTVVNWIGTAINYGEDYKGRVELSPATGTLKFNKLFAKDAGEYKVVVTTEPSSISVNGEVELKVDICPSVVSLITPQNTFIGQVGGVVTFNVSLDPPSEQANIGMWAVGSKVVVNWIGITINYGEDYEGRVELTPTTGTLKFNKLFANDSGEYILLVSVEPSFFSLNGKVKLKVHNEISSD